MSVNVNYVIGAEIQVTGTEALEAARKAILDMAASATRYLDFAESSAKAFTALAEGAGTIVRGFESVKTSVSAMSESLNENKRILDEVIAKNRELVDLVGRQSAPRTTSTTAKVDVAAVDADKVVKELAKLESIMANTYKWTEKTGTAFDGTVKNIQGVNTAGEKFRATIHEVNGEIKNIEVATANVEKVLQGVKPIPIITDKEIEALKERAALEQKVYDIREKTRNMAQFQETVEVNEIEKTRVETLRAINKEGATYTAQIRLQNDLVVGLKETTKSLANVSEENTKQATKAKLEYEAYAKTLRDVQTKVAANKDGTTTTTVTGTDIKNMQLYTASWTMLGDKVVSANVETVKFSDTVRKLQGFLGELNASWQQIFRVSMIQVTHRAVSSLITSIRTSINDAQQLQKTVSQIQTISKADFGLEVWAKRIAEVSNVTAMSAQDVAQATYSAISNQIADGSRVLQFVEEVGKFAVATQTDVATSTDLLSSALNSYNLTAADAEHVSGVLFKTLELGRINVNQLAQNFGRVGPMANQLGVGFEELNAYLATVTIQGTSTSSALTMLQAVMSKMLNPSKALAAKIKEMGFESGPAMIRALGLADSIRAVRQAAEGADDELAKMFNNVRGLQGILAVTGKSTETFSKNLEDTANNVANLSDKFAIISKTPAEQLAVQMNKIRNYFAIDWGSWLLGLGATANRFVEISSVIKVVTPLMGGFVGMVGASKVALAGINAVKGFSELREGIVKVMATSNAWNAVLVTTEAILGQKMYGSVVKLTSAFKGLTTVGLAAFIALGIQIYNWYQEINQENLAGWERTKAALQEEMRLREEIAQMEKRRLQRDLKPLQEEINLVNRIAATYQKLTVEQLKANMGSDATIKSFRDLRSALSGMSEQMRREIENVRKALDGLNKGILDSENKIKKIKIDQATQLFMWEVEDSAAEKKWDLWEKRRKELEQGLAVAVLDLDNAKTVKQFDSASEVVEKYQKDLKEVEKAQIDLARANDKTWTENKKKIEELVKDQAKLIKEGGGETRQLRDLQLQIEALEKVNGELAKAKNYRQVLDDAAKQQVRTEQQINEARKRQSESGAQEAEDIRMAAVELEYANKAISEIKPSEIVDLESFNKVWAEIENIRGTLTSIPIKEDNAAFIAAREKSLDTLAAYERQLNESTRQKDMLERLAAARQEMAQRQKMLDEVEADSRLVNTKAYAQSQAVSIRKLLEREESRGWFDLTGDSELPKFKNALEALATALEKGNLTEAARLLNETRMQTDGQDLMRGRLELSLKEVLERQDGFAGISNNIDNTNAIQKSIQGKLDTARDYLKASVEGLKGIKDQLGIQDDPVVSATESQTDTLVKTLMTEVTGKSIVDSLSHYFDTMQTLEQANLRATQEAAKVIETPAPAFARGGWVRQGGTALDTIPAFLSPGEFVVNRKAASEHATTLQTINQGNGGDTRTMGDVNITLHTAGGKADLAGIQHAVSTAIRRGTWRLS